MRFFFDHFFNKPKLETGDNFWFFFSGHGVGYQGEHYLVPSDGYLGGVTSSIISVDYITQCLRRSGADNIILVLDSCRSEYNLGNRGVGWQPQQGLITLASCSPQEESYEIPELKQGAFTYALLEAFRSQGKEYATVEKLCNHLRDRVPELNRSYGKPSQTPYTVVEPHYKNHFILLPQQATSADISLLREEALEAEAEGRLAEAKELMIRALRLNPDNRNINGYERIILKIAQQPPAPQPTPKPATESKKPENSIQEVELKSVKGIDYTKLRDLLAQGKWQEADRATARVMLVVANRTKQGWMRMEDMDNFPCEDLKTINSLWVHHSGGKFGFSVQKEIYQRLGGTREYNREVWEKFGDTVGWSKTGKWIGYLEMSWDGEKSSKGYLPMGVSWVSGGEFRRVGVCTVLLFSRVETCKL